MPKLIDPEIKQKITEMIAAKDRPHVEIAHLFGVALSTVTRLSIEYKNEHNIPLRHSYKSLSVKDKNDVIALLREGKMSKTKIAELAGCSRPTISRIWYAFNHPVSTPAPAALQIERAPEGMLPKPPISPTLKLSIDDFLDLMVAIRNERLQDKANIEKYKAEAEAEQMKLKRLVESWQKTAGTFMEQLNFKAGDR